MKERKQTDRSQEGKLLLRRVLHEVNPLLDIVFETLNTSLEQLLLECVHRSKWVIGMLCARRLQWD